ncbi:MAG TPA: hypothetical protein P5050_12300 [Bacteroidia bacterium]|nr:hypothetical protein [Bacteroidia bacterium]
MKYLHITLVIFLFLRPFQIYPQQCGYEHLNAFVLNIHAKGSNENIKGLRIYLVDENNKPYFSKFEVMPHEMGETWRTEYDTMMFWNNSDKNIRLKGSYPLSGLRCAGAEDNYLIIIPEYEGFKTNPGQTPFYQARIVDVDGEANGGFFPTKTVRLPYGRSINLCKTDFVNHTISNSPHHSDFCEGGKIYSPIEIIPDKDQEPMMEESFNRDVFGYTPVFDTLRSRFGDDSLYAVKSVVVRSQREMKVLQVLEIPELYFQQAAKAEYLIKFGDFYNDNHSGIRDFYVKTGHYKDSNGLYYEKKVFFSFNHRTGFFDLDTLLSNYYNVEVFDKLNKIIRNSYQLTPDTIFQYSYQLIDKNWIKVNTYRTPRKRVVYTSGTENSNNPEKKKEDIIWLTGNVHRLKAFFPFNQDENVVIVKDTFRFINHTDKTLKLEKPYSDNPRIFTLSQEVKPNDTGFVYYTEYLTFPQEYPDIAERILFLNNPGYVNQYCKVQFVISGFKAQRIYSKTGKIEKEFYPHVSGKMLYELDFDENGKHTAFGLKMKDSDERQGIWKFWDEKGNLTYTTYSKTIGIQAGNKYSAEHHHCRIAVRENGKWIQPFSWENSQASWCCIKENTDSIRIFTDSSSNTIRIDFFQLNDGSRFQLFLINHGDFFIRQGYYNMALELSPDKYAVVWDRYFIHLDYENKISNDSLMKLLVAKYPGVKSFSVFGRAEHDALDLSELSSTKRKEYLEKLSNDRYILKLSQLFRFPPYHAYTYSDGQLTLTINHYMKNDDIYKIVNQFGFGLASPVPMAGGSWTVRYLPKLLDKTFFENFNKLCSDPNVMMGSVSTFGVMEAEGD